MPVRPEDLPEWEDADRIADRIVDLMNEEIKRPGFSPLQMFAGQMLAILAMLRSAPRDAMPAEMMIVEKAIGLCLTAMMQRLKPN